MKLILDKVYIVEVRDRVTLKRTTVCGVAMFRGDKSVYFGGYFQSFTPGWINEDEIEWASKPYPRPTHAETEAVYFGKYLECGI